VNIVFDAHMLGEQEGGNETYAAGLVQGFAAAALPAETSIKVLYQSSALPASPPGPQIEPIDLGQAGNFKRIFSRIPRICEQVGADLLHVTYNAAPWGRTPLAVSVHDVIFRHFPRYFSPRVRVLLSVLLPLSMRRARAVITLSEASKRDILRFYPFTAGKVHVIPLGPGQVGTVEPDDAAATRYSLNQPFFLAVGTLQPRKNLVRLISAYTAARERGEIDARLLIVGRAAWQHSEVYQIAQQSRYCADVVFTGYLSDAALAALYRQCLAFVYPSLYEGFGLPVLEAMACGAPVITSATSSLPEVAGDAALLVDPYSTSQIREALAQIGGSPDLRQRLAAAGVERASRFSWRQTAEQTLEVYRSVLSATA
jgi:glycosyltransferase involved in cell wall biosynthesis